MVESAHDSLPRILILTAGYGEGHNSAAKGIAEALQGKATVRVADPCSMAMPGISRVSQASYRWLINYAPKLWRFCFRQSDAINLGHSSLRTLAPVKAALKHLIEEVKPQVVISTYMLYPYLLRTVLADLNLTIPSIVVVTDSSIIHSSWTDCEADLWCVTDDTTQSVLVQRGLPEERIAVTGFPVAKKFLEEADRSQLPSPKDNFRILYVAQGSNRQIVSEIKTMLAARPEVRVTAVLGRKLRSRYAALRSLLPHVRGRLRVMGWTKRISALMATHHLVVSKAGGATTHESLAAHRPMLVTHLVPGQEEGNIALLEELGCGQFVANADALGEVIRHMLADEAQVWHQMQKRTYSGTYRNGSATVADLALQFAPSPTNPSLP